MRSFLPFELEHWLATHEGGAERVLGNSGMTPASFADLGLDAAADPQVLGYGEIPGEPALLEAIARARGAEPDQVLVTIGGSEADFLAIFALCKTGDKVLTETPTYHPLAGIPHALGCRVERFERRHEDAFRLDVDALLERIDRETRMVALTNPNNPTGQVVPHDDLRALAEALADVDGYLLVDEIFRQLAFEPQPTARGLGDNVVVTESLTKTQGLPGLRTGWILAHPDVVAACREPKALTSITNPPLLQHLAIRALEREPDLLDRSRGIARENLRRLEVLIDGSDALEWVRPQAAPISAPRLTREKDDVAFAKRLLKEARTLVVPGTYLGLPGHLRIGYGGEPEAFADGLARLEGFLTR